MLGKLSYMKFSNEILIFNNASFITKRPSTLRMVLLEKEKLEFVKTSVFWIEGRDKMDSCFTLNYGYEAPLPWPQVLSHNI